MRHYWQSLVEIEKQELDERLYRLNDFIKTETFAALSDYEQQLLMQQQRVMRSYSAILANRIAIFDGDEVDVVDADFEGDETVDAEDF